MRSLLWGVVAIAMLLPACDGDTALDVTCGNAVLDPGEDCDDGNAVNTDGCTVRCRDARCGDGLILAAVEQCDDGNAVGGDGCSALCRLEAGADGDAGGDADGDADADVDAGTDDCVPGCDGGPCDVGEWSTICPGTFQMGSPESEPGHNNGERQHSVTLTHRFEILSTEVTQAQFLERMGYNPSVFPPFGGMRPVDTARWSEAAAYCNALSSAAGLASCYVCSGSGADVTCDVNSAYATPYACPGYRLPTEAEWEFAARAGTTGGTYNGTCDEAHLECDQPNPVLDSIAWFCGNCPDNTTHAVGTLAANPWGLFDMLGNVWELCGDWCEEGAMEYPEGPATDPWGPASGEYRRLRGGGVGNSAMDARAATRTYVWSSVGAGFRPARSLP